MTRKRGNGEGSIGFYGGRWIARATLPSGKRKAVYGKSRAEVARKLTALSRDRDAGLPSPNGQTTVGQYLGTWLEDSVRPRNRQSTYESYEGHVRNHLVPAFGGIKLTRLTPQHVERMMRLKAQEGLSPATITRIRATLRRALSRAEKHGLVQRNVAALADPPRVEPKAIEPMTTDEARVFLESIIGHRFEALFMLALATGLRRGELLGLLWNDVDLDGSRLYVRHALQRLNGNLEFVETKTPRSRRYVALAPTVVSQLQGLLRKQSEMRDAVGSDWNPLGLVFPSRQGTPLDGTNVTHTFQAALEEAGLPRMRFHDLRHACASFMLAQGASMRVIMEQLGHSQIGLTMNTYSHVMPEAMHDAAALMENILVVDDD